MPVEFQPRPDTQRIRQQKNVEQKTAAQDEHISGNQTSTFEGRHVSVGKTNAATIAPDIRQSSPEKSPAFRQVSAGENGFINRHEDNAQRPDIRKTGRLANLGKRLKSVGLRLIRLFFRRNRTAPTNHTQGNAHGTHA